MAVRRTESIYSVDSELGVRRRECGRYYTDGIQREQSRQSMMVAGGDF